MPDIPQELVEKAAKALWQQEGQRTWEQLVPVEQEEVCHQARAVLEAVLPDVLVALDVIDKYKPGAEGAAYAGAINSAEDEAAWIRTDEEIREEAFRLLRAVLGGESDA